MEVFANVIALLWLTRSAAALYSTVNTQGFYNVFEQYVVGITHADTVLVVLTAVFIFSGGLRSIAVAAQAVSNAALQVQSVVDRLKASAKYQTSVPNGAEQCNVSVPVAVPPATAVAPTIATPGTSKWARRRARKAAAKAAAASAAPPATSQTESAAPVVNPQPAPAVPTLAALPLSAIIDGVPVSLTVHLGRRTPPFVLSREAGSPVRPGLGHWSFGRRLPCHFGARCRYGPSACRFEHVDPQPPGSNTPATTTPPRPIDTRTLPPLDAPAVVVDIPAQPSQFPSLAGGPDLPLTNGTDVGASTGVAGHLTNESARPQASESPVFPCNEEDQEPATAAALPPAAPQWSEVAAHDPVAGTASTPGSAACSGDNSPRPRRPLRRTAKRPFTQDESYIDAFYRLASEAVLPCGGMGRAGLSQQPGTASDAASRRQRGRARARGRGGHC